MPYFCLILLQNSREMSKDTGLNQTEKTQRRTVSCSALSRYLLLVGGFSEAKASFPFISLKFVRWGVFTSVSESDTRGSDTIIVILYIDFMSYFSVTAISALLLNSTHCCVVLAKRSIALSLFPSVSLSLVFLLLFVFSQLKFFLIVGNFQIHP